MAALFIRNYLCYRALFFIQLIIFIGKLSQSVALPPNIIFILADDLGWDDVSFHGAEFSTPNIDRLAKDGVILNNYYVQPMCTPTRGAVLTGKYPIHTGLQHYVIAGSEPYGLPLSEITLAQHLQTLGYSTRAIGKWHLGFFKNEYLPEKRGFDSHYGYYLGRGDFFDHYAQDGGYTGLDLHDNGQPVWNETDVYSTELFTRKAIDVISTHNKTKPLFLYLAYQAVHAGNDYDTIQAPQKFVNRFPYIKNYKRRMFAGVASALDDAVGQVFASLQDSGMADNSVIIFSTDNGGPANGYDGNAACNWPLRGTKNTLWQGGVRGVAFVLSPLLKRKSYINNNLMHAVDWLPTILNLVGGNLTLQDIDGINQWETISDNADTARKEVLLNIDPIMKHESLIVGNYKIIFGNISNGENDGWYPPNEAHLFYKNLQPSYSSFKVSNNFHEHSKSQSEQLTSVMSIPVINQMKNLVTNLNVNFQKIKHLLETESKLDKLLFSLEDINKPHNDQTGTEENARPTFDFVKSRHFVNCGPRPVNTSTNCQPLKHPCLYNIADDPCEFHNLADTLPETVTQLMQRLDFYRATMIPPGNKPIDPKGDPSLHDMVWGPWL